MIYKYTFLRSFTFRSFYLISPSQILNFQFSFLNWQKAYLLKSNKRESISILVGFTFDSRLVLTDTIYNNFSASIFQFIRQSYFTDH